MPIDAAAPLFPPRELLARFFALEGRRPRIALAQLAALLGMRPGALRAVLLAEGGRRNVESIPWAEAAAYLFDAWPRAAILAALGPAHAGRIPAQFHPARVEWSIPTFIVRAMVHQAAAAASPRGVDDYVTDLLFNEIEPETLLAFGDDPAFAAAYHYPYRG